MIEDVNVPLLRKAVEWVEEQDKLPVTQSQWYQAGVITPAEEIGRDCGTCYCVAGYIASLVSTEEELARQDGMFGPSVKIALSALNLDIMTVDMLFSKNNTAPDVRRIAEAIAGERL